MEVRKKIRDELDRLFVNAPQNRAAWELQEELLANSMERYDDLVKEGMQPEDALNNVISSIGNVDELIAALPPEDKGPTGGVLDETDRHRSAMFTTVAIGLYIVAVVIFLVGAFIGSYFYEPMIFVGLISAALICIVPTCMLVYNAQRHPRYKKKDDTVVESFKQWSSDTNQLKSVRKAISSIIWTLAVVLYFIISFATFAWAYTWIIFPLAACVEAVVGLLFRLKEMQ